MKRTTEVRRAIKTLAERVAHLVAKAHQVEAGTDEWSAKTRRGEELERTETHKLNYAESVAYWREARENEKRLDELRSELRALEARAAGEPIEVHVEFDGAPEPAAEHPAAGG